MKIAVVGTGYVGLVAGTCFAETGNRVVCVDVDEEKIKGLQQGKIPIFEPGLSEMVRRNAAEERLFFTTDLKKAVEESLVIFIAVGTPPGEDGSADLTSVLAVAHGIGKAMNGFKIIVDKSTVPVGTARKVAAAIREETDHPFQVVSNPEFLKEGAAIDDFMKPDRVVIGTDDPATAEIMKELYSPYVRNENPILVMDPESAELTKYTANAMLATRISFMNEIARICEKTGANFHMVRRGVGTDSRIGMPFLYAGCGYGGSCFPKDVKAIMRTAQEHGYDFRILQAVEEVNRAQKSLMVEKVKSHFGENLSGRQFTLWGLAFKPKTDDVREAPSIVIARELMEAGARVVGSDPEAIETTRAVLGDSIRYEPSGMKALEGSDALILVTEWHEFRHPDFEEMAKRLKQPVIFDGRNIYSSSVATLKRLGFTYYGIGVPSIQPG